MACHADSTKDVADGSSASATCQTLQYPYGAVVSELDTALHSISWAAASKGDGPPGGRGVSHLSGGRAGCFRKHAESGFGSRVVSVFGRAGAGFAAAGRCGEGSA